MLAHGSWQGNLLTRELAVASLQAKGSSSFYANFYATVDRTCAFLQQRLPRDKSESFHVPGQKSCTSFLNPKRPEGRASVCPSKALLKILLE